MKKQNSDLNLTCSHVLNKTTFTPLFQNLQLTFPIWCGEEKKKRITHQSCDPEFNNILSMQLNPLF